MNGYELPPGAAGLVAALAVGLVIGLERGWHDRELPEEGRVAGLRTFALTGLLGGVLGHLQPVFGAWPLLGSRLPGRDGVRSGRIGVERDAFVSFHRPRFQNSCV